MLRSRVADESERAVNVIYLWGKRLIQPGMNPGSRKNQSKMRRAKRMAMMAWWNVIGPRSAYCCFKSFLTSTGSFISFSCLLDLLIAINNWLSQTNSLHSSLVNKFQLTWNRRKWGRARPRWGRCWWLRWARRRPWTREDSTHLYSGTF